MSCCVGGSSIVELARAPKRRIVRFSLQRRRRSFLLPKTLSKTKKNPATETHVSVSRVLSFDASRRASKLGARNRRTRSARRLAGRRPEVAPPPRLRVSRARPEPRHSSPRAHALLSPPPPAPWRSTSSSPAWAPPPRRTSPWRTSGKPRWSAGSPSPASPRRRRTRSAPTSRRFSRRWA